MAEIQFSAGSEIFLFSIIISRPVMGPIMLSSQWVLWRGMLPCNKVADVPN